MLKLRSPVLSGLSILILCSVSCTNKKSQISSAPVLQVNNQQLTAQEFAERLARKLKNFDALSAKDPNNLTRAKEDVLRAFTMSALIADYAQAQSLQINDEELNSEANLFRSAYPDDVSFRQVLAQENLSLSTWKEQLKQTLVERKVFQKLSEKIPKATDPELRAAYEANKERFRRKERIYLRQILSDDLNKATELREAAKKKDFVKIATQFSVAIEGKNGGLVGWVEKGTLDVFDKAFSLPIGSVSNIFSSSYGYHIFKVEKKAPAGLAPFEEVRHQLEQEIRSQKEQAEFTSWLDKQIRTSRVLRNQEVIRSLSVETRKE